MATKSSSAAKKNKTQTSILDSVRRYRHFRSLAIVLLSLMLYGNAVNNGYNLDDELVTRHHRLTSQGIAAIPEIFTSSYYQDNMGYSYEYRPIVLATFALEHQIFGESPAVSHFINVILYALCCLILLKTLELLFAGYSSLFAFLVTLIFVAHPAHTEVVCSIKNRDEILAMIFGLGALYYSIRTSERRAYLYYPLIALLFTCALMSKATIVTFVLIIPMCIIFFRNATALTIGAVSFALLVPCYLVLDLGSGFDKVKALSGLVLVILVVFGTYRFRQIFVWIKERLRRKPASIHPSESESAPAHIDLKGFFSEIIPSTAVFRPGYIIPTIGLGVIYVLLVWHSLSLVALLPLLALAAITVWGRRDLAWSAGGIVMLLLAYDTRFLGTSWVMPDLPMIYSKLAIALIFFFAVWVRRDLFLAAVGGAILILMSTHAASWPEILLPIPLLYLVRFRQVRLAVIGLIALLTIHDLFTVRSVEPGQLVILVLLSVLHFRWHIYRMGVLALVLLALLFHYNIRLHDVNIRNAALQAVSQTSNSMVHIANSLEPKIISQTQYRPIIFIENCESPSDPIPLRVGTSADILLKYLQKVIFPYPMSFYYGYSYIKPTNLTAPRSLLSIAVYAILTLLALVLARRKPVLSIGIFIYLISISVFSNFFIGIPGMMADRFLLIPSLGWCIALVALIFMIARIAIASGIVSWGKLPRLAQYLFLSVLLLYTGLTLARNTDWKDDLTLFRRDIRHVPESAQAHNLLAVHLMQHAGEESDAAEKLNIEREALGHFMAARAIYPKFFNVTYDIGRVYMFMNNADSALIYFQLATQIDSVYPDLYKTVGDIYNYKQKYQEAIPYYSRLITLTPQDYYGYGQLSYQYYMLKRYDESIAINQKALNSVPDKVNPRINIARAYLADNSKDSAAIWLKQALAMQPANPEAQNLLKQAGGQ
ncbi:MAG: tetratricopeptide repeat protein [Bacteroidetes bacterium]|nr:tetratricopeptide repeat protein [Bacteroidota bacterium]